MFITGVRLCECVSERTNQKQSEIERELSEPKIRPTDEQQNVRALVCVYQANNDNNKTFTE